MGYFYKSSKTLKEFLSSRWILLKYSYFLVERVINVVKKISLVLISCFIVFSISINALAANTEDWNSKVKGACSEASEQFEINNTISAKCKFKRPHFKNDKSKHYCEVSKKINEYLKACAEYKNFHGSILVENEGKVILKKGYGMADYENSILNEPNTRFAIGSVTKQFTAMAIMQLYEKGKLSLDDNLSKYIPDFPRGDEITVHHLLTHTSGIVNYTALPEFWTDYSNSNTIEAVIDMVKDMPLEFEPGASWNYCNTGYVILGDIVEKVTRNDLGRYLEKNIFKPLNMKNTGVSYKNGDKKFDTVGYDGFLEIQPIDDSLVLKGSYGAGFLYSTVEDLYRWEKALDSGKLVSKKTMEIMFSSHVELAPNNYYGYGWVINNEGSDKEIYHDGSVPGFASIISRYVERNSSIIVLSNNSSAGSDIYKIKRDINSILLGLEVEFPVEKKEIVLDIDTLDSLTGTYEVAPGIQFDITREGSHLYAKYTGQDRYEIYAESENRFFYKVVEAEIAFDKDENGQVEGLTLYQLGIEIPAVRLKWLGYYDFVTKILYRLFFELALSMDYKY